MRSIYYKNNSYIRGDYLIELNNFYIGESVNFMRKYIPDGFVDLTVTSPPYDDLRNYKGFIFDYQNMLQELYRVIKPGGIVVWVVGDATIKGSETGTSFKHVLCAKEIGFNLHDTMIYEKVNPLPLQHNRYQPCFEFMFVLSKNKPKTFNPILEKTNQHDRGGGKRLADGNIVGFNSPRGKKTKYKRNVWRYSVGPGGTTHDKIGFKHPAIFPDKLAEDHIISWSNENDIVLDPMCGAGTTCKMAWLNKRSFIGIDMSEEYINEICIPRLKNYGWEPQKDLLYKNNNCNINI